MLLDNAVLNQHYTTSVVLTPGTVYSFKVTSRTLVGDSDLSLPVSILAARHPDIPTDLQNVPLQTTAYLIGLIWQEATYNGGSEVLDYRLSYGVVP